MARIVLVGAGSITFAKNLLSDILTFPELAESTIVLHDIDPERLATAEAMATWMVAELGVGARIEAHIDRRAALDGADYVINEIAVGGLAAVQRDFEIPARYGVRQTIADTLGIGGIFRALRTIPVMVSIGNDLAELAPGAVLFNYTNPMSMIPWAVYAGTPFRNVVGVCHAARDTQATLARMVGVPEKEISFVTAGVNHQAFVLRFERDGENLYRRLDELIEASPELRRRVRVEIYRNFGYFPTESSEHGSEYLPWFLSRADQVERYRIPVGVYLDWLADGFAEYESQKHSLDQGKGVTIERGDELASLAIHSIETGTPRLIHGNVRNAGLIANLPADACVEVPCHVDRAGVQPTRIGELPTQLAALNRATLNVSELTVKAALEGRRDHVYQAALLDPNTAASLPVHRIRELVDELIAAHGDLLPEGVRS
ncbi:alpha-galactosidase [Streptosporangium canum]|uniref:Alpha-galactosidase n=1 Tax=Streptosporangium canum TaxID=324952 RepID=A0A1I3R6K6_9ACTN|nr:alpha-glucosidase/alpha-galactosidase [Streptosporangium canum]SFJ40886.1 alpha-galactosidase [Streptosporangium canum]